jgi:hypothetical protein
MNTTFEQLFNLGAGLVVLSVWILSIGICLGVLVFLIKKWKNL